MNLTVSANPPLAAGLPVSAQRTEPKLETSKQPPSKKVQPKLRTIMGNNIPGIASLLKGWTARESDRSSLRKRIVYFEGDVSIVVSFYWGRAVGVAVVDKPGFGQVGISLTGSLF